MWSRAGTSGNSSGLGGNERPGNRKPEMGNFLILVVVVERSLDELPEELESSEPVIPSGRGFLGFGFPFLFRECALSWAEVPSCSRSASRELAPIRDEMTYDDCKT